MRPTERPALYTMRMAASRKVAPAAPVLFSGRIDPVRPLVGLAVAPRARLRLAAQEVGAQFLGETRAFQRLAPRLVLLLQCLVPCPGRSPAVRMNCS